MTENIRSEMKQRIAMAHEAERPAERNLGSDAMAQAQSVKKKAEELVEERPLTSVLVALIFGAFLAAIFGKPRKAEPKESEPRRSEKTGLGRVGGEIAMGILGELFLKPGSSNQGLKGLAKSKSKNASLGQIARREMGKSIARAVSKT